MNHRFFTLFIIGLFLACAGALWAILAMNPGTRPRPAWNPAPWAVERVKEPVPPRFSAPLPSRVEGFWEQVEQGPPPAHIRLRLLEGEREMGERYLAALRQAAPHAESLRALWETYGEALLPEGLGYEEDLPMALRGFSLFQGEPPPCEWLVEHLRQPGAEPPRLRELLWWKLVLCPGAEAEALFALQEAPLPLVLRNYQKFGPPRLTAALRNASLRVLEEDRQELFGLTSSLLVRADAPEAQALYERMMLQARGEIVEDVRSSRATLQQRKEQSERDCRFMPRAPNASDALKLNQCLARWAQEDWAATAQLAVQFLDRSNVLSAHAEAFENLRRFSSVMQRDEWARERGLLPETWRSPARGSVLLHWQMSSAGRALSFYPQRLYEPDFPVRQDDLLASMAWLARPELRGVVFEEVAPPWDEERGEAKGDYTLRAYLGSERFSVTARNLGIWWDVGAVVALLNELLASRGSEMRFAVIDSIYPVVTVLLGPEPALSEAHAQGLLRLGDPAEVILQVRAQALKSQRALLGLPP